MKKCIDEVINIFNKMRNDTSMVYFGKPFIQLQLAEILFLDNYMKDLTNPDWKDLIIKGIKTDFEITKTGLVRNKQTGKLKKFHIDSHGYPITQINLNGKVFNLLQHRAVAKTFIPNPDNKPEVNHKDGIKTHSYYMNLEWVTGSENIQHSYDLNLRPVGEENALSKYKENDVREICKLLEVGMSVIDVSRKLNIDHHLVGNVFNRACWKHISDEYNIPLPKKKEYLKEEDIHEICRHLAAGKGYAEIAKSMSDRPMVNRQAIRHIAIGSRYVKISDQYDIPGLEKSYNKEPKTLTERLNRMYDTGLDIDTPALDIIDQLRIEANSSTKSMISLIRRNYKNRYQNKA